MEHSIKSRLVDEGYPFIIAFDPGVTTGVAKIRVFKDGSMDVSFLQQVYTDDLDKWIDEGLVGSKLAIIESFLISDRTVKVGSTGPSYQTIRNIGRVEHGAYLRSIPVTFQSPAEAKTVATDAMISFLWGIKVTHEKRHQLDALRHITCFLHKNSTHFPWYTRRMQDYVNWIRQSRLS